MIFEKIPCIYYPTKVVMLDDNLLFIENIRMRLDENENISLFDSPTIAIDFITSSDAMPACLDVLESIDQDELDFDNVLSVDYAKLASFYKYENQVSVLIVDYAMPEINGVEFFEKIKSHQSKKIMLTGNTDTTIGLDAFNNCLIDKFITKDASNITIALNNFIHNFKKDFFLDSKINQFVSSFNDIKDNCDYIAIFNSWVISNNIVRFHQIDENGSMVGADSSNEQFGFYVLGENKLCDYINIAEENAGPAIMLDQLHQRKKIPVFLNEKNKNTPVCDWIKLMHDVNGMFEHKKNTYYYCFV